MKMLKRENETTAEKIEYKIIEHKLTYEFVEEDERCILKMRFDKGFNMFLRREGGEWIKGQGGWFIPSEAVDKVKTYLYKLYGSGERYMLTISIKRYKVKRFLHLLNRNLLTIDHINRSYRVHPDVTLKGDIPISWGKYDGVDKSYSYKSFLQFLALWRYHFVLKNVTLTVLNVAQSELDTLKSADFKWIDKIIVS